MLHPKYHEASNLAEATGRRAAEQMKTTLTAKRYPRWSQIAYTIAEVMVGIGVMGIFLISLYAGMSSGFVLTQSARENLRASQIMLERMEGIRLYHWNQLAYSNWIPSTFTNWYYPLTNAGESPGIMYVGQMSVSDPALYPSATYESKMRRIRVVVTWKSGGVTHQRSMSTYVSRNGVQNYVYEN